MFKDYDKYLSTSLKVYLFVLVIVFILKLVGLDYFGLDSNNYVILKINNFMTKYNLVDVWYLITLYIYGFCIFSITCKDNSKKMKLFVLLCLPLSYLMAILKMKYKNIALFCILDVFYLYLLSLIYLFIAKKSRKNSFKRYIMIAILNIVYQVISLIVRNNQIDYNYNDFTTIFILNFDYLIMILITMKIYFWKGGIPIWVEEDHISSSLKKINLKTLLKKLQRNLHNFKQKPKVERISLIIYIILSLIWNTLSLLIILIVAKLNDTFIECLFILTSFWLSKRTFGKAFHLSSMAQCFIVSNLTYYALNRITTPIGVSILIPILLGVGLSYFTSKLVKKTYKPLYKGMPEELFEETILKVTDKGSMKYNVCYDFYIGKESDISLSFKYNYSIAGIRKIKDRINDKIKELK